MTTPTTRRGCVMRERARIINLARVRTIRGMVDPWPSKEFLAIDAAMRQLIVEIEAGYTVPEQERDA